MYNAQIHTVKQRIKTKETFMTMGDTTFPKDNVNVHERDQVFTVKKPLHIPSTFEVFFFMCILWM